MRRFPAFGGEGRRNLDILLILLIAVGTFGLSLANDFVWDDWALLVPNEVYSNFDLKNMLFGLANSFEYLPVRDLTLAIDAAIWGMNPFGFHLSNLLIYLCSLLVVHLVVRRMANLFELSSGERLAFWTTLVFAIHPLHAEVINFVGARNTLLSSLFLFLSLAVLLRGLQENRGVFVAFSLFYYLLAIFSKAIVVFFPAFLLCFFFTIPRAAATVRIKAFAFLSFSVTTAVAVWLHIRIAASSGALYENILAYGSEDQGYTIGKAFHIIWFYLRMLVVPYPLSVEYQLPLHADGFWLRTLGIAVVVLLLIVLALILRKKTPFLLVGLAWFLTALLPVLNFLPTHPVVADRYAFLGVFGFALAFACLLDSFRARQKILVAAVTAVVIVWSGLSLARTLDWRSDITLWKAAIQVDPKISRLNLAGALWKEERFEEALDELKVENELTGSHLYSRFRGRYLFDQGRTGEALQLYKRSLLEGGDTDPSLHLSLGLAYETLGDLRPALDHYLSSLEHKIPGIFTEKEAQEGLERIWVKYAPQIEAVRRSAEESPQDFAKQNQLGLLLHSIGQYGEALTYYQRALQLNPSNWQVWHNIGLVKKQQKRFAEAAEALESALALNPGNLDSLNTLGVCYGRLGHHAKAEENYLRALQRDPAFIFANFNLAKLYFVTGDKEKARDYFSRVLNLNDSYRARVNRFMSVFDEK